MPVATLGVARAIALLSSLLALFGCSAALRDPCKEATAHLTACLTSAAERPILADPEDELSHKRSPCVDRCIQQASCGELTDAFSGTPTEASSPFLGCTMACSSGG